MKQLVLIKDLQIYGEIINEWKAKNIKDEFETNLIIKDMNGIEHERFISEVEIVDDIETSIKKAKCNLPLEKLIDLFNNIDKRFKIHIKLSHTRDGGHGDMVNQIYICYGDLIFSKDKQCYEEVACIIRDGKLIVPDNSNYICKNDEYECCLVYVDTNLKDVVFELYINIITKIGKNICNQ